MDNTPPSLNINPPGSVLEKIRHKRTLIELAAGFLVVLGLAVFTVYQVWPGRAPTNSSGSTAQKWLGLSGYTACDKSQHQGIYFLKPTAFNQESISPAQAVFYRGVSGSPTTTGVLLATCTDQPASTAAYLAEVSKNAAAISPQGSSLWPLYQFVAGHTSSNYDISFGKISLFKNAYIKDNAWQMDLSFSRSSSASSALPSQKEGRILWLAGKTTWYYVLLSATTPNWQANQTTWNKILDSVQIDQ